MLAYRLTLSPPEFAKIALQFDTNLSSTLANHPSPPISSSAFEILLPVMQAVLQIHLSSARYPQRPHSTQRTSRRRTKRHETKPAKATKAIKATKFTSQAQQPKTEPHNMTKRHEKNGRNTKHSPDSRKATEESRKMHGPKHISKIDRETPTT